MLEVVDYSNVNGEEPVMPDNDHPVGDTDQLRYSQQSGDPRRWKALAVVSVAQLMLILDLTVGNVALRTSAPT